ncbi:hypothetical protein DdX_22190 [Ditylenchus destructor]|uniref:Uncharacterized protein n=1 Tax=Ditylenchus destructor TaxID=166010 RepID=A0AAD4QSN3_9BILA|nr:hypothetical protein DdX_22190 [Ditylenchus destructor]
MTTASPAKIGMVPTTRSAATISPQTAPGKPGLVSVARMLASIAATTPTSRSSSKGKGNDRGRQRDECEDEPKSRHPKASWPSLPRGQDTGGERRERGRYAIPEIEEIDI